MPPGPRMLIIRFGSLGDVVLATPLLRAIRRRYADAQVTVVTRSTYVELFRTNPAVTDLVPVEPGASVTALARSINGERFDHGLDLQRSIRSRRLRRLVPTLWGLALKARAARLELLWTGTTRRPLPPVVERYFAAAEHLDIAPDAQRPEIFLTSDDREAAADIAPEGCVVLVPGARWASKRWPPERWADLGQRLVSWGETVVALGTGEEQSLLQGRGIVAAYGRPLRVAAAVLERARVAVTHDSGAMHVAAAVGTPVVTLMGPTVRAQGFVPGTARVVELPLPCRPCSPFGSRECPLGHHRCLGDIDPAIVAALVRAA